MAVDIVGFLIFILRFGQKLFERRQMKKKKKTETIHTSKGITGHWWRFRCFFSHRLFFLARFLDSVFFLYRPESRKKPIDSDIVTNKIIRTPKRERGNKVNHCPSLSRCDYRSDYWFLSVFVYFFGRTFFFSVFEEIFFCRCKLNETAHRQWYALKSHSQPVAFWISCIKKKISVTISIGRRPTVSWWPVEKWELRKWKNRMRLASSQSSNVCHCTAQPRKEKKTEA